MKWVFLSLLFHIVTMPGHLGLGLPGNWFCEITSLLALCLPPLTLPVPFSSLTQSCLTLCNPMDSRLLCPSPTPEACSNSVHRVSDAIKPSHPLSSPSPAFHLSQHQDLFEWVSSSHQVTKVLELQPPSPPPQSFPASESFPMNWLFASGDQSIGASASVCPKSGLISFRMDWFDLLAVQGILKSLLQLKQTKYLIWVS